MNRQTIKALGDWEIEVLGIPNGSDADRDADGEYFTPDTQKHEDKYGLPPVVVYHGMDKNQKPTKPEYIGRTLDFEDREDGRWYRAVLDKGNAFAAKVWDAVQKGTAAVSSGTNHLHRIAESGLITEWPVTELSIWDNAAGTNPQSNPKAIAMPAKYQVIEQQPEAEKESGGDAENNNNEVLTTKADINTAMENNNMSEETEKKEAPQVEPVDVAAIASDAAKAAVKAYRAEMEKTEPVKSAPPVVTKDEADKKAETVPNRFGHMLQAVKAVALQRPLNDMQKAILGANESVPAEGGFLVRTEQDNAIEKKMFDESVLATRTTNRTIGAGANSIDFYGRSENSRATGSRYGGIQGYRVAEGGAKTASNMEWWSYNLKPSKYAVLAYASDEVTQDAALLESEIMDAAPSELAFMVDDDIMNGTAAGYPEGILLANSLVTVAKEAGQLATTIVAENIIKMWARLWAKSQANAVWYINQDTYPQLSTLNIASGTAGVLVWMPPGGLSGSPYGSLYGRPVIPTEFNPTLGTIGDIVLADLSQYKLANKGAIQSASSMHVQFTTDQMCWRFVARYDGQASWEGALTPYKGTNTQSPFVALATRS